MFLPKHIFENKYSNLYKETHCPLPFSTILHTFAYHWRITGDYTEVCPIIIDQWKISYLRSCQIIVEPTSQRKFWSAQYWSISNYNARFCSDLSKIGAYLIIPQADQHDSGSDNCDQPFGNYNDGIASRLVVAPLHQAEMSEGASSPGTIPVSKDSS